MSARRMHASLVAATLMIAALGTAHAQPAPAATGADCSYVEIAATNAKDAKDASFDAELKPLEKKLKKPPFTSWNTFKKLSAGAPKLSANKPETLKLNQSTATVMLRGRTAARVELDVTL